MFIQSYDLEVSSLFILKYRIVAVIYPVSVYDDIALQILPVDLLEFHRIEVFALNEIRQHVSGSYGGQLILVSHEDQSGTILDRIQQGFRESDVHHGRFIHNDAVVVQLVFGIFCKTHGLTSFIVIVFQKPVDRLGEMPSGLHYPLGGPTCRRGYGYLVAGLLQDVDYRIYDGGLAGSGSACNDCDTVHEAGQHRPFLVLGEVDLGIILELSKICIR